MKVYYFRRSRERRSKDLMEDCSFWAVPPATPVAGLARQAILEGRDADFLLEEAESFINGADLYIKFTTDIEKIDLGDAFVEIGLLILTGIEKSTFT